MTQPAETKLATTTAVSTKTVDHTVTEKATETSVVTEVQVVTETASSSAQPTGQLDAVQLNQIARSGGIELRVTSFKKAKSFEVDYNDEGPTVKPRDGAVFVVVTTKVKNKTKASIDLTCSFPIDARVADVEENNFDPIDDLYKIKGNPKCNSDLQPGFDDDMTWIFEVPTSTKISVFGFREVDLSASNDFPFAIVQAPNDL